MDINLLQQVIDAPKIRKYANPRVTRAGLSSNPVERFNFTSGTIFSNDQLVQHGGAFFVGSDTATHEFDFSTKVAGSVAECPMKISRAYRNFLQTPTDSWVEDTVQADLDNLKTQDNVPRNITNSINGNIAQFLVELDLTPLCNSLFGGSNAALKAALKGFSMDNYIMASGANGGALTYGVQVQVWNGSSWSSVNTNAFTAVSKATCNVSGTWFVNSSNKMYVLINSQYASDGTIASSVSLDYVNIKIDIAKVADTVSPISVNLPKYWAMCIKGVSTSWDSSVNATKLEHIVQLYKGANTHVTIYRTNNTQFTTRVRLDASTVYTVVTDIGAFGKYRVVSIILTQSASGIITYFLLNNGTVIKSSVINAQFNNGVCSLSALSSYGVTTYNADAFAESFNLIDLQRLGKSNGLTDSEAEVLLRGIPVPDPNQEMVVNGGFDTQYGSELVLNGGFDLVGSDGKAIGWTNPTPAVWDFSTGKAIQKPTATYQELSQVIAVSANTQYQLGGGVSTDSATPTSICVVLEYRDGSANVLGYSSTVINVRNSITITTPVNCASVKLILTNNTSIGGTNTFDNISLKQVLAASTGWTVVSGSWDFSTGKAVTSGNGVIINAQSKFPVLPNSKYNLKITKTGVTGYGYINFYNSASTFISGVSIGSGVEGDISLDVTTPPDCFYARVDCLTGGTGTSFTFDNISLKYVKPSGAIALPNPELFDISKVTLHANAQRIGNTIVLNASAVGQQSTITIPVLPNNQYEFKSKITATASIGRIIIQNFYNSIYLSNVALNAKSDNSGTVAFTTPSNCNAIKLLITADAAGTFTFSNISLKRKE